MLPDGFSVDNRTGRAMPLALLCALAMAVLSATAAGAETGPPAVGPLLEDLRSGSVLLHREAAREVEAAGPATLERLAQAVRESEPEQRAQAAEGLAELGARAVPLLIELLGDDSELVRQRAAQALGKLGPDARRAGPQLLEALKDPHERVRAAAADAVAAVAEPGEAVSALIPLLSDASPGVRASAAGALQKVADHADAAVPHLARLTQERIPFVRTAAAQTLGAIGPEAAEAVPALVRLLGEPGMESAVARASLVQIGEASLVPLVKGLRAPRPRAQWLAARALSELGQPAVAPLMELAGSAQATGRAAAVSALALMEPQPAEAEQVVLDALRTGRPHVRAAATLWYTHADEPSEEMEAALFEAARGEDAQVARAALRALADGREANAKLLGLIEGVAGSPDEGERAGAIRTLGSLGEGAAPAMPALLQALQDESPDVRREAIRALRHMGPGAAEAVPLLTELLGSELAGERREAAVMLGALCMQPEHAVPALAGAAADQDANVRVAALNSIGEYGEAADLAVPAVLEALEDEQTRVRTAAAAALSRAPIAQDKAVAMLVARLDDEPEQPVLRALVCALGEVGRGSDTAIDALTRTLSTAESQRVREAAARALERIGPEAKARALDELIEAACADHVLLSVAAWQALAQVAPGEAGAVEALTDGLHSGPASLRRCACEAIGRMGQDAASAVPALVRVLEEDPSVDVRAAAARNLALLGPAAAEAVPVLERNRSLGVPELTRAADYALESIRQQSGQDAGC